MNLVQPLNGGRNRWITKAQLIFDGHTKMSVALDASSRTAAGQTISFGRRRFSTLEIKITDVSDRRRKLFGGADAVGFAEIRLRDDRADHDVQLDEVEQMPQDLLDALGAQAAAHPLILVMTRDALRPVPPRTDPELSHLADVRAARAAHVRADRQREREPERVERRDRDRARDRADGHRERQRVAHGMSAVPRRECRRRKSGDRVEHAVRRRSVASGCSSIRPRRSRCRR